MLNNKRRVAFSWVVVFLSLVMAGCIPSNSGEIKIEIRGIDATTVYSTSPDFSLDYSASAKIAEQQDAKQEFKRRLGLVRVELNATDITQAFVFSDTAASINKPGIILQALQEGANSIVVKRLEDPASGLKEKELDRKDFSYSITAPYALIDSVRHNSNADGFNISGYLSGGHPVVAVKINGTDAVVSDNQFSVTVPYANNYVFYIEDAIGKKRYQRYSSLRSYNRNAIKLRINRQVFNTLAIRGRIASEVKKAIDGYTGNQTLLDTTVLGVPIRVTLKNIVLDSLRVHSINLQEQAYFANMTFGFFLTNPTLVLGVSVNGQNLGNVTAGLDKVLFSTNVLIGSDADNHIDLRTRDVVLNASGVNLDIPPKLLPDYIADALPDLINDIVGENIQLGDAIKGIINDTIKPQLAKIQLAAVIRNVLRIEAQVDRIYSSVDESGVQSIYVNLATAVAATETKRFAPLGFLSTANVRDVPVENRLSFQSFNRNVYNKAVSSVPASPTDLAVKNNVGLNLNADLINAVLTSVYQTGVFDINAYLLGGEVVIADQQPQGIKNFDLRFKVSLLTAPEITFRNTSAGEFKANILVPNVKVDIDVFNKQWDNLASLNMMLTLPADIDIVDNQIRIIPDKNVGFETLRFESLGVVEAVLPAIEKIISTQLIPVVSKKIAEIPVFDLNSLKDYGVSALDLSAPDNKHLGIGLKLDILGAIDSTE